MIRAKLTISTTDPAEWESVRRSLRTAADQGAVVIYSTGQAGHAEGGGPLYSATVFAADLCCARCRRDLSSVLDMAGAIGAPAE